MLKKLHTPPLSDMSDMSDIPPPQQLTVNPDSRGHKPVFAWFAYCPECEMKKPFTDPDNCEQWIKTHRFVTTHGGHDEDDDIEDEPWEPGTRHRVQIGAGKIS